MPSCGPIYCQSDYLNIVKYKHNISMYSMCMNGYVYVNFKRRKLLYIDGHPHTPGKIAGFINSSRCSLFSTNCSFEEHVNDQDFFMKRKSSRFVVVQAIHSLSPSDELLINYTFCRPPTACQRRLTLVIFLDVHLGCKTNKH